MLHSISPYIVHTAGILALTASVLVAGDSSCYCPPRATCGQPVAAVKAANNSCAAAAVNTPSMCSKPAMSPANTCAARVNAAANSCAAAVNRNGNSRAETDANQNKLAGAENEQEELDPEVRGWQAQRRKDLYAIETGEGLPAIALKLGFTYTPLDNPEIMFLEGEIERLRSELVEFETELGLQDVAPTPREYTTEDIRTYARKREALARAEASLAGLNAQAIVDRADQASDLLQRREALNAIRQLYPPLSPDPQQQISP